MFIGFGLFDAKIPRRCCELYDTNLAPLIVFTGGVGAGSADLTVPEAEFFRSVARDEFPHIPDDAFVIEPRSTNTGENVRYSLELLARRDPPLAPGAGLTSVILVANAYRQRRVVLTAMQHMPGVSFQNAPPRTNYESERLMFADRSQDIVPLMLGELDRMRTYPARGIIAPNEIPDDIMNVESELRRS